MIQKPIDLNFQDSIVDLKPDLLLVGAEHSTTPPEGHQAIDLKGQNKKDGYPDEEKMENLKRMTSS